MSLMSQTLRAATGILPGIGRPLGAGVGGFIQLAAEPEIPSAMDDWDTEFERATGALPEFSPIAVRRRLAKAALGHAQIAAYQIQNLAQSKSLHIVEYQTWPRQATR